MVKALDSVDVELAVVLGKAMVPIHQLLKMGRGAVIELDATVHDPATLYANNQLIAKGEVVVVNDHIAVSITDTIGTVEE